jgi:hypothetical protein
MKIKFIQNIAFSISVAMLIPSMVYPQGIEITPGANITVSGAATIVIQNGNFINNGVYTKANETFTFSGNTAAMVSGTALSNFNNLMLSNTGGVSIDVKTPVTVSGTLTNTIGAGGLLIKSNSTGYGSLIHNTPTVQAKVERQITAATWTDWNDGWHFLSSPVGNQPVNGAWTPVGTNNDYDLYSWSESAASDNWLNQKVTGNNITSFIPGQGYMVAYQQTEVKTFTGTLNTSTVVLTGLTHTAGRNNAGWHLVGNPFTSALNWGAGSWIKTNIGANAKIWVEATRSYKDVITDYNNIIPAMNGFMVYVDESSTGNLTIPADARIHNTETNWLKSAREGFLVLTASDLAKSTAQETIIRIDNSSTNGFDIDFDSKFMTGFAPMFYSVAEGNYLSLNTLPDLSPGRTIELGFVKNKASSFSIELSTDILPAGLKVYLNDKLTGTETELTANPVYYFNSAENDNPNRFSLRFSALVTDINPDAESKAEIYAYGKMVHISPGQQMNSDVNIHSTTGQLVQQARLKGESSAEIDLSGLPAGIYIVSVAYGKNIQHKKVFIK